MRSMKYLHMRHRIPTQSERKCSWAYRSGTFVSL